MPEPLDPFEALRDLNPVDSHDVRDAANSPEAKATLARILSETSLDLRARRTAHVRRLYRVFLVPALAAAVAVAAAVVWLTTQTSPSSVTIRCYESASLDARSIQVVEHGRTPTLSCSTVWSSGSFGSGPVPRLQACVLPTGTIAVFPREDGPVCTRLGLAPR